jgi:hypothetical protein
MRRSLSRLYVSPDAVSLAGKVKAPQPSIAFLVIVNGLIFFAVGAVGNHPLGILFHAVGTVMFMMFSALPQILIRRFAERNRCLKPVPRSLAYLSPILLLLLAGTLLPKGPQKPNHLNPAPSPDGRYEARFSSPSPGWDIVVVDTTTGNKWKEETPFMPHLQIYWRWDANNRLWIYNSDNAGVHFLEPDVEGWTLKDWGWSHTAASGMGHLSPPAELYPEYARAGR